MDLKSLSDVSRRRLLALFAGGIGTVVGGSFLLGALASNRVDWMLPRVQAAIDAEQ